MKMRYGRFLIIVLVAYFFISSTHKAKIQPLLLEDLFKIHSLNQEQIEDFVISKGYIFDYNQTPIPSIVVTSYYIYDDVNARSISLSYNKNNKIIISDYRTQSVQEYMSMKNQIKQKGYYFDHNLTSESMIINTFKRNPQSKYVIDLVQSIGQKTKKNYYTIQVINSVLYSDAQNENK